MKYFRPFSSEATLGGVGFGIALWFVTRHLSGGDDLFHLARVRKLDDFGGLSLRSVDEFRDGGLHPGYAFPLWHAFLALVARLGGVDPTGVVLHEASVLVPAAFLVAWESGKAVFRSAWGGLAVLAAQVSMFALAAGGQRGPRNPGGGGRRPPGLDQCRCRRIWRKHGPC